MHPAQAFQAGRLCARSLSRAHESPAIRREPSRPPPLHPWPARTVDNDAEGAPMPRRTMRRRVPIVLAATLVAVPGSTGTAVALTDTVPRPMQAERPDRTHAV